MKKALLAMVFSGLMVAGAPGCGGGGSSDSDLISKACNKMASCVQGATSAQIQQCKDEGKTVMDSLTSEEKAQATDMVNACIAKDCATFMTCMDALQ